VKVKLLADASLDRAIVTGLRGREPSIDFLDANEAKLAGVPDKDVLGLAAREGRILVSLISKQCRRNSASS
jgi:hypothetical protein